MHIMSIGKRDNAKVRAIQGKNGIIIMFFELGGTSMPCGHTTCLVAYALRAYVNKKK